MIRRLLYHLHLIDLVWLKMYNSEPDLLRMVWKRGGRSYAYGICAPPMFWDINDSALELLPAGEVNFLTHCYIKSWRSYTEGPVCVSQYALPKFGRSM